MRFHMRSNGGRSVSKPGAWRFKAPAEGRTQQLPHETGKLIDWSAPGWLKAALKTASLSLQGLQTPNLCGAHQKSR